MEQVKGPRPSLPAGAWFPVEDGKVDPADPPLLAFEDIAA